MNKLKALTSALMLVCGTALVSAQTLEERVDSLEAKLKALREMQEYLPHIHGILRGKYEYEPNLDASRFEARNARLSADGNLPFYSAYKLEVDLCDESAVKMKDAWVRLNIPLVRNGSKRLALAKGQRGEGWTGTSIRVSIGQQRMPFSIDAHRNPSVQYFANRSFIAKQVGDMRDVGVAAGTTLKFHRAGSLNIDAGVYNGSNLDNQKTAWFKTGTTHGDEKRTSPAYSARLQYFPIKGFALVPSVQHQLIANRQASYTSFDMGSYFERKGLHLEAEYLRKFYANDVFADCNAANAMAIYKQRLKKQKSFIQDISYLIRYDYMDNHSDGKKGFDTTELPLGGVREELVLTDAQRHRLTAGVTFSVRNKYFPTDIRLNYEKYWYPHGGTPKESEQDKLVAELMIRF